MRDIFNLFRLAWQEKRYLFLALVSSLFVASFTYIFVNLIQPIIDELFRLSPSAANATPGKFRLMDFILSHFHLTKEKLIWFLPVLLFWLILP